MTEWMVCNYSDYGDAATYFSEYAVQRTMTAELTVPTTILTAVDDPVIPAADIYALHPHPLLDVHVLPYGGHVGFIHGMPFEHKLPLMIRELLE
jgi:predicted alpha/beta-fold hydrolase